MSNHEEYIILFDGVCNLCNSSINFIIKHDPKRIFRYAAMQSGTGRKLKAQFKIQNDDPDTVILVKNNEVYEKSDAVFKILSKLPGAFKMLYLFIFLPRFIRDFFYDLIAANRYKFFGKKDTCMIPAPEIKELFLD